MRAILLGCVAASTFALGCSDTGSTPPASSPPKAQKLALGNAHSCALARDGRTYCWGFGQFLGNGVLQNVASPVAVRTTAKATDLGVGNEHGCFVDDGGAVQCWGTNTTGAAGNDKTSAPTPRMVTGVAGATKTFAGEAASCALTASGHLCWGDGNPTPTAVVGFEGATSFAFGELFTCAIVTGGAIRCRGKGSLGQLGNGQSVDATTPVDVSGITGATAVDAGDAHACAILGDRSVRCWGSDGNGRLGDGATSGTKNVPVAVTGIDDAIGLAVGGAFTCVLRASGTVACFGTGTSGELGDGKGPSSPTPVTVAGLQAPTAIAAGAAHACAVHRDGRVACWGRNGSGSTPTGAIGSLTLAKSDVPVDVVGFE